MTRSHQAEVSDLHEAMRQRVQQEATQKFLCGERHGLVSSGPEAHAALIHPLQPMIGQLDTVGIATEVGKDLLGPSEGRLGLNHPGLAIERVEQRSEGSGVGQRGGPAGQVELSLVIGLPKRGEQPAAEELAENLHREEVAAPPLDPARAVEREPAADDDAVQVRTSRTRRLSASPGTCNERSSSDVAGCAATVGGCGNQQGGRCGRNVPLMPSSMTRIDHTGTRAHRGMA
ncbi:hypothetical protein WMF14_03040 [Sorangium sp. So ce693]